VALLIALLTIALVQEGFNSLVKHSLSFSYLFEKGLNGLNISLVLLALMLAGIFISGFYPAFVLSSFRPIVVLKGKYIASRRGIFLRKGLVIGQFAVTVGLIIGSFVVYRQIKFVNDQNLGFNLSQLLIIKPPVLTQWDSSFINRENSFINALNELSNVKGAATSSRVPGDELGRTFNVHRTDINSADHFTVRFLGVDHNFIGLYGIKLLGGRSLSPLDYNYDFRKLHNIIINESTVKLLGYSSINDALGKSIMFFDRKWDVIGVIRDFHQKSLRYPLEPTVIVPFYAGSSGPISVKVETRSLASTLSEIKQKFDSFFPGNLFDYYFIDQKFNEQYQDDKLFGKVFGLFAGFAIFIACLGLLGLSLFATTQRTKEIGVRKVLGASISNIVFLLSKDFVRLIIYAFVIASPLAWLVMNNWLQNFAYRINISWWIFLAAGLLAIAIALVTISFQSIRAALANPANSLRTE
jgi:putative ABC transport system permease protein